MTWLSAVAATGTVLTAGFLVPQVVRLVRGGDVTGVSPSWGALGVITNGAWVAYLGTLGMWEAAVAPALATITYGITFGSVLRLSRSGREWQFAALVYSAALAVLWATTRPLVFGLVLAVTPVIQISPGVRAVFRERKPRGVSAVAWTIGFVEASVWGLYGLIVADGALIGYGLVTAIGSSSILYRLVRVPLSPSLPFTLGFEDDEGSEPAMANA